MKLTWPRLIAFALPAAPLMALTLPSTVYLPPYFTEVVGIPVALVGAIFLAARFFDIFIDPLIGTVQDRFPRPFGMSRRRGWLVVFTIPLVPLVWLVYHAPTGTPIWLAVLMILSMFSVFAGCMIAHLGWAAEIEPDYAKRAKNLGVIQIASVVGMLAVILLPIVLLGGGVQTGPRVHLMGLLLCLALPVTVLLAALFVPEPETPPEPHASLKESLDAMKQNKALRIALLADFASGFGPGLTGALFLWYFSFVLEMGAASNILLVTYFITGVIGMPAWIWLATKVGKHKALTYGSLYAVACNTAIVFIPPGNVLVGAIGMGIAGLAYGAPAFLIRAMIADVTDEDELLTGRRRAGLFYGLMLTTSKVGIALAVGVSYPILGAFGFDAALGVNNGDSAKLALSIMFIVVPALFNILMAVWVWRFPITPEVQAELRRQIEAKKAVLAGEKL
jgi:glycoside/pentoside/hexuronide:cation symporter, GPH family